MESSDSSDSESGDYVDWIEKINAEILNIKPLGEISFPIEKTPYGAGTLNDAHYAAATEACRDELLNRVIHVISEITDTNGKELDDVYWSMRSLILEHERRVYFRLIEVMAKAVEKLSLEKKKKTREIPRPLFSHGGSRSPRK